MAQLGKPRAASIDQKTTWSWKRFFGKDGYTSTPSTPPLDNSQKPGLARRLSQKVVPNLPRSKTFKRQQSELRDRLEPVIPPHEERRTVSVDRRRNIGRTSTSAITSSPRLSAPELLETQTNKETIDSLIEDDKITVETAPEEEVREYVDVENEPSAIDTQSISTEAFDEMILEELEKRWILNLSMHFRDKSKREKFFVTYAETPTHWRRVTISLDYRNAPEGSLEEELLRTRFQRDKSARIYEAIRESLIDIQFYDTVTNLKLQTDNERLHVHVVEDVSEIISYPSIRALNHLNCRRIREDELVFDSHLSGFVYKVRVDGQVFIKKEIPGPDTVDEFLYEINALHQLADSRSVIQFGGVVLDNKGECVKGLLISFAEQGALIDVIYDGEGKLPWKRRERWARQIVQGLSEIHEAGFVQGDFTLSNIVIDEYDDAKIIDINRRGCPVGWEPPEVRDLIESNQRISMYIGVKSDLYQLGMVLYALATQHDEPEHQRPFDLTCFPAEVPDYFLDVCRRCLDDDPRRRLQASVLLTIFPEMEDDYHDQLLRPVPIVVDAKHVDEKPFSNYQCKSGIHSPPYSSSGMDRSINVHDYAVTDMSETDFYPRRGRSPPSPHRMETAGTSMPFSDASIQFLQAHVPLPQSGVLSPEATPLPDSSTGSENWETTRDTSRSSEAVEFVSAVPPNEVKDQAPQKTDSTGFSTGYDCVDFAIRNTPTATEQVYENSNIAPSSNYQDIQHVDPAYTHSNILSNSVHQEEEPKEQPKEPDINNDGPEYMDEKAILVAHEPLEVNLTSSDTQDSQQGADHLGSQHPEREMMNEWTQPETSTEEPRTTVAAPEVPELYPADLAGVGSAHNSSTHFSIPPAANLDHDLMTETR